MSVYDDERDTIEAADCEISNEQIQRMAAWSGIFQDHVETIANKYLEATGNNGDIIGINWGSYTNRICINLEMPSAYRDQPSYLDSELMPIELLWDENWEELLDKISADRLATEKRADDEKRQRAVDERKACDLRRLARLEDDVSQLKAKYKED